MTLAANPDQAHTTTSSTNNHPSSRLPPTPATSAHPSLLQFSASANNPSQSLQVPPSQSQNPSPHNLPVHSFPLSRKRPAALMLGLDKTTNPSNADAAHPIDPHALIMQPHPHQQPQQHREQRLIQARQMHQSLPHINQHDTVHTRQDDTLSTVQGLYNVTLDSPSSPGTGYKRMRSSTDSDAGSSSCKDMDEPEVLAPDSVPALVLQIRQLLDYIASKPALQTCSASFVRDYLRTMLMQNSFAAQEAIQAANKAHKAEVGADRRKSNECFKRIPEELAKHILGFLDGHNLARAREVCRRWNEFACEDSLWKDLCLKRWKSLETDPEVWKLIDKNVDPTGPNRWRQIFPKVNRSSQWNCRLQKTGRFICNLIAHQISGAPLAEFGLPSILVVERRFNILHLQTFVLHDASVLYFEPESESDRSGFDDFIEYLNKRSRAGLALEDQRRFIFIPPCQYTRTQVEYQGRSLLGVVQNAYPPLAP